MGDMADYYAEQEHNGLWPTCEPSEPRITRASKWKSRDGQLTAIRNLKKSHLMNILKMHADGRLQLPDAWLAALEREAKRR